MFVYVTIEFKKLKAYLIVIYCVKEEEDEYFVLGRT